MTSVTYLPAAVTVEGRTGDSLLELALDFGVDLDHNCGGICACTTCRVIVQSGADSLSPMAEDERERLTETDRLLPDARLACQSRLVDDGPVIVLAANE
jgi:2Fe-2S ferredoxin